MSETRKAYPSDVTEDEWAFVAPYLALLPEDAGQRVHDLRQVFNALRYLDKTGGQWRYMPHDFPPWPAVYQQARQWVAAKVFEQMADDLRVAVGKQAAPSAAVLDGRTVQSTRESGERAGYDGYKRRKGAKGHIAVDTLGNLLALTVTAESEQERAQLFEGCEEVQQATGQSVTVAFADQGDTGDQLAADARNHGIELVVVKPAEAREEGATKGFVLRPKRWVVERTFAWLGRFRRLARDFERLAETLAGWHWVAAVVLLLKRVAELATETSSQALAERGYRGGDSAVREYVRRLRVEMGLAPARPNYPLTAPAPPTARRLSVAVVRHPDRRTDEEREWVARLKGLDDAIRNELEAAEQFAALIRERNGAGRGWADGWSGPRRSRRCDRSRPGCDGMTRQCERASPSRGAMGRWRARSTG